MRSNDRKRVTHVLPTLLAALAILTPCNAQTNQTAERFYLIEILDSTGEKTYQTVALDQYHKLRSEASLRNRYQARAVAQAREDWKETYNGTGKAFPPNVASPESVNSLGIFTSHEAARTKMMELRARIELRRNSDSEKLSSIEKQIKAVKEQIKDLTESKSYTGPHRDERLQEARNTLRLLEKNFADQQEKKSKQEQDLQEARSLYDKKLTALISATEK